MRKNKLINLLKLGILLFGISLLLWNCEKEESFNSKQTENESSEIENLPIEEKINFLIYGSASKIKDFNSRFNSTNYFYKKYGTLDFKKVKAIDFKRENAMPIVIIPFKEEAFKNNQIFIAFFNSKKEPEYKIFKNLDYRSFLNNKNPPYFLNKIESFLEINTPTPKLFARKSNNFDPLDIIGGCRELLTAVDLINCELIYFETCSESYIEYPYYGGNCSIELDEVIIIANPTDDNNNDDNNGDIDEDGYGNGDAGDWYYNPFEDYGPGGENGGNDSSNNNEPLPIEPDLIINNLTGKPECVYNKLSELNLFETTIGKFIDNPNFHIQINNGTCPGSPPGTRGCSNGQYINNGLVIINITNQYGPAMLNLAQTILHEGIHAELTRYVYSVNNNLNLDSNDDRPRLMELYMEYKGLNNQSSQAQHFYMTENYVAPMASAIRELDNNKYPLEYYMGFGWDGLARYGLKSKMLTQTEILENERLQKIVNDNTIFNNGCN